METSYILTEWDRKHFSVRTEADRILSSRGIREVSCCIICSKKVKCQKTKEISCQEYALAENSKEIKRIIVETLCDTF